MSSSFYRAAAAVIGEMERFYQRKGAVTGVATGLSDLDAATGGLQRGQWTSLVCALDDSEDCLDLTLGMVSNLSGGVLWFGPSDSFETMILRWMCHHAKISVRQLYDGLVAVRERRRLQQCADEWSKKPLFTNHQCRTMEALCASARAMIGRGNVDLIVVEDLSVLNGVSAESMCELKKVAVELDAALVTVSYLDNPCEVGRFLRSRRQNIHRDIADAIWVIRQNLMSGEEPASVELNILKGFWTGALRLFRCPVSGHLGDMPGE